MHSDKKRILLFLQNEPAVEMFPAPELRHYLLEQCSMSLPEVGLSHTTHTVGPKQEPALNRCPFSCLSLASLSFPFPLENHARDIGVNKEAIQKETKLDQKLLPRRRAGLGAYLL